MIKNIIFSLFILITGTCFADPKIETCYDAILWVGSEMPDNFNRKHLTTQQEEDALELGLLICECRAEDEIVIFQEMLSSYYFTSKKNKNYKKAMYWAREAVEDGSSFCMNILRAAYCGGSGVVQDYEEGLKWGYLASSLGDEESKQLMEDFDEGFSNDTKYGVILRNAQNRAKAWQKNHEHLFFNKN